MGGPFSRLAASPEATSPTDRYSPKSSRLSSRGLLELYGAVYCPSHLPVLHVLDLGLTGGRSGRPCLRYHFLCISPEVRLGIHRSHRHEPQRCGTGSEHQWHDSSRRLKIHSGPGRRFILAAVLCRARILAEARMKIDFVNRDIGPMLAPTIAFALFLSESS